MRIFRTRLILVLVLLVASPALAQVGVFDESTCREVDPGQLGKDASIAKLYLKFNAKILALAGDEIIIRGNDAVPLKLDEKLAAGTLAGELRDGDNIRVFGILQTVRGRPGQVFMVKDLKKRAEDLVLYREDISALEKAGDIAGLHKKGKEIEAEGQALRRESVYRPIARDAFRAAIALREKQTRPDDPEGWIALAGDYHRLLGDRQSALDRLTRAIRPAEPVGATVRRMLDELNAVYYGGEYVLFEAMKEREGFVDRGGKWVLRERAAFDDALEAQRATRVTARKLDDEYYSVVARSGNIELGMTKPEVAVAIGYPDDVDRQRRGPDLYDAWTYEGRGTFFFENNQLFKRPDMPR